jgi:hypothetical protein
MANISQRKRLLMTLGALLMGLMYSTAAPAGSPYCDRCDELYCNKNRSAGEQGEYERDCATFVGIGSYGVWLPTYLWDCKGPKRFFRKAQNDFIPLDKSKNNYQVKIS